MSCSVAATSSPVFSPSRISLAYKTSPENVSLSLTPRHISDGSLSPASFSSTLGKFQSGANGLRAFKNELSYSSPIIDSSYSVLNPCRSASVLKRKRPSFLDIPNMGLPKFEVQPDSEFCLDVEVESGRYSVHCRRGMKRLEIEDRHCADLDINGDSQMAFFGIFDGHGGPSAAKFASENIGKRIVEELARKEGEGEIEVEEAVKNGYLKTDAQFLKEEARGGACCVTVVVRKGDLIVSNAGDCRAVLSVSGAAKALTSDHRPSRKDEKSRIVNLGGYVDCCRGVWRLQGSLAVSRGIGDYHLKQWVTAEPETRIIKIEDDCEFLILASDGLWEKVSNQEAVDVARPFCVDPRKPSPLTACKKLVDLSVSRGSMDDISVMIIQLRHFI